MNSKSAIARIKSILGLSAEKFYEGKTEQGLMIKMEGEMELGQMVYVATEEGLIPAPMGVLKLEDGTMIEVDEEGKLKKIDMGDKEPEAIAEDEAEIKDEKMSQKFADVRLADGSFLRVETYNSDEVLIPGRRLMKVLTANQLAAIADGNYETADGKVISIIGGSINSVQTKAEYDSRKTGSAQDRKEQISEIGKAQALVFTIAEDAKGQKLDSPSFDVGEDVMVIGEDGEKSKAPDGEHQVVLKDESGNENKIRIITKDGKITERENVEEPEMEDDMEKTMMEVAEIFKSALSKMETKLDSIVAKQNELEGKFQKFSKEPAGQRVFTQKTINTTSPEVISKYDGFRRLREELGLKK